MSLDTATHLEHLTAQPFDVEREANASRPARPREPPTIPLLAADSTKTEPSRRKTPSYPVMAAVKCPVAALEEAITKVVAAAQELDGRVLDPNPIHKKRLELEEQACSVPAQSAMGALLHLLIMRSNLDVLEDQAERGDRSLADATRSQIDKCISSAMLFIQGASGVQIDSVAHGYYSDIPSPFAGPPTIPIHQSLPPLLKDQVAPGSSQATRAQLEAYRAWLAHESAMLAQELYPELGSRAHRYIPASTGVEELHFPLGAQPKPVAPPSSRALTVLAMAGADFAKIEEFGSDNELGAVAFSLPAHHS
ncbi:hypothetical protein ACLBXM_20250 [Xanthobacteraceae bacterium A53D]